MSVQVSYKKQFTLGILLIMVLLASVEGLSRTYEFFSPRCSFIDSPTDALANIDFFSLRIICNDTVQVAHLQSTILLIAPNQNFETININSHGFRGPDFLQEKPEDTYRIFVVGGSTTYGVGSTSDETTIPGFLQEKFSNSDLPVNVEVINAGIGGAESTRETFMIQNMLLDFEPDLFIVYDGWNDAQTDPYELNLQPLDKKESFGDLFKFANFPYYRTPFVIYEILFTTEKDNNARIIDESFTQERISTWKNNWIDSCMHNQQENIKTIITIQPMIGSGNKILTEDESKWKGTTTVQLEALDGFVSSFNELEQYCTETADLRNVFDNYDEPVFFDQGHVNDFGNKIVAENLFELSYPIILNDVNH